MKYIIFTLLFISVSCAKSLTISTGEWKPWVSQSLQNYGIAPVLTAQAFKQVGVEVDFVFYPWKRAYKVAKVTKADASGFWLKTAARQRDFYFSKPLFSIQNRLIFKKKKNIQFQSIQDLQNYTIGVTRGYSYSQEIDTMILQGKIRVKVVNSDLAGLRQVLKKNTMDAFLCSENVAQTLIKENFTQKEQNQIQFSDEVVFHKHVYLMVSKQHRDAKKIVSQFNEGLEIIQSKGKNK